MITNLWKDYVSDKTISLLCSWIEYRLRRVIRGAYFPTESKRFVYLKSYNKNGMSVFRVEIREGLDFIKSTRFREFGELDEFTYAFYDLSFLDQIVILSYIDPFDEMKDKRDWKNYLKEFGINGKYYLHLKNAMVNLQRSAERRSLVRPVEGELRGLKSIAKYLNRSVPTLLRMMKRYKMPIAKVGGNFVSTKEKLDTFMNHLIENNQYWKQ